MAQTEMLKGLVKPPFATYDIVVYFGGGIFALPILNSYVGGPAGMRAPIGAFDAFGVPFIDAAIATLFLLFSVYVLGHLIAYVASEFIERGFGAIFGKTSSSILVCESSGGNFGKREINRYIAQNLKAAFLGRSWVSGGARLFFHLPVLPAYLIVFGLGIYGYWRTRIPSYVMTKVRNKISTIGLGVIEVSPDVVWYKTVEHYVLNRLPTATARMYNYLVISGLFRSLSFIFLFTIWLELIVAVEAATDGTFAVANLFFYTDTLATRALVLILLLIAFVFCGCAYLKFQRRYVEEAIFAFALEPDEIPT